MPNDNKKTSRAVEWARLLSFAGAGQALVQGLALVSGFLVIQLMAPQQYAFYTLAYATLGTIGALGDSGIASGVMATGGRDWGNRTYLGGVLAAGFALRRLFFAVTMAIALPLLVYMLLRSGADKIAAVLIVLALVPAFYASMTEDLLEIPLKLNQDIKRLQANQALTNLARVAALVGSLLVLPLAAVAVLANGLPRIWANVRLRRVAARYADAHTPATPEARREIAAIARKSLPGALYFAASGQITIWLVSIYGSTTAIAQVGALGRFAAVLSVFGGVFSTVVVPRFARLPAHRALLVSRFCLALGVTVGFGAVASALVYALPQQMLWVLGKEYASLDQEVVLSVLGGSVFMVVGVIYGLCASRGWVMPFAVSGATSVAVQAGLIALMDLSTPANVMLYSLYNATWGVALYLGYFIYRIIKLGQSPEQDARP